MFEVPPSLRLPKYVFMSAFKTLKVLKKRIRAIFFIIFTQFETYIDIYLRNTTSALMHTEKTTD